MSNRLPVVELHPVTVKYLKKGHPWVTYDQFSKRFPKSSPQLIALDETKRPFFFLLNDPNHSDIKARLWDQGNNLVEIEKNFLNVLKARIQNALKKREKIESVLQRENFYLIFGESDLLPGLHVLKLGQHIILQFYAQYWENWENIIVKTLQDSLASSSHSYWIQERNKEQKKVIRSLSGLSDAKFELHEFGIKYRIQINSYYDLGIYTDMSSIRFKLRPLLEKRQSLLNLFCYTGAFSLFGLSLNLEKVYSVDLSKKYLDWLDENIALNPQLKPSKHIRMECSVEDALKNLKRKNEKFDFIICDPPSSSSDGKKKTQAFQNYDELFPLIDEVASSKCLSLIFLNTHTISWQKFEEKIKTLTQKYDWKIIQRYQLSDDCPTLSSFPEGNYLKGLLIEKN